MKKRNILYLALLVGVVAIDQITKIWAEGALFNNSITIIKDFFYLTYATNTGAAWSIFAGKINFFIIITLIAIVVLGYWFSKSKRLITQTALVLMIAGAFGNFIDRLMFGYVRDFLDFYIFGYDFPIFNVADSFLCIGVALLFIDIIIEEVYGK